MTRTRPATVLLLLLALALAGLVGLGAAVPARAATLVPVSGAGSTWSQNALDQWQRNVLQFGMRVNFQGTGSSDGRNQYKNGTVDFAVSEIPYGLTDNNVTETPPARGFAYMPIVAGGTAFMYNLKAGGKRITNLRLTGEQLTKIFTGVITRWDDAGLAAENPGLALPARPIVPVVRSDGSGTSAQFTLWMSKQHPQLWNDYCAKMGRATPCSQTSSFPSKTPFLALAGSLGVAGYVSQDKNEGTITYVEESYALNTHFPVVKLLNSAGYYVEPNAGNVAVALQGAQINEDLTQKLDGVYNNNDKRAYPLSSYSYMIVPTKIESPINEDKGYTLSRFANYFLCQGQQAAPDLGYSPLPRNLVEAGLEVVKKIPGHDPEALDISKCQNPTFSASGENLLAKTAPEPPECDKKGGPAQCTEGTGGAEQPTQNTGNNNNSGGNQNSGTTNTNTGGGETSGGGQSGAGGGAGTGGGAAGTGGSESSGGTGTTEGSGQENQAGADQSATGDHSTSGTTDPATPMIGGETTVDPDTGQVVPATGSGTVGTGAGPAAAREVSGIPVALSGGTGSKFNGVLVLFAVMLLVGLVLGPPLAARRLAPPSREEE